MHGVLVLVSVLAIVYTRILVSDRIGACPYRPFSTPNLNIHHGLVQKHARITVSLLDENKAEQLVTH